MIALATERTVHYLLLVAAGLILFVNNLGAPSLWDLDEGRNATAALEMAVIPLYWRFCNLWPLGVLHGWLGALFYLWVLNTDMWELTFARMQNLP